LTLVTPAGVGSPAPCLGGGNVLFFDGEAGDYIHPGVATITQGSWTANQSTYQVHVHVDPASQTDGLWWDVYFDSSKINQPLTAQVYAEAERWPFQSANKAGLDVSGDGRGCNMLTGRFQIETLDVTSSRLTSFTATFEQHCDGGPALHGCVHFEQ
jgi:prepilin-type processing-associated H-X9-DG protein